ncbi:MAG TPA: hypothetical protein VEX68_25090 [Bryobacteraceae bacterium]|nr:hypothetical protein [Bryobacteraceae bacterium]
MANVNPTPTTIEQYREAKNHYLKLKNQAKKELVARFNALAAELLQVQRELLEDFGEKVSLPKTSTPKKVKAPVASPAATVAPESGPADPAKVASLNRQLHKQRKRLEELKSAGKATKAVEDRIYELEDELRLLQ